MRPLWNYTLCKIIEQEEITESGLAIAPKQWAGPRRQMQVIAIGPDVTAVKVGDNILYSGFTHVDTDEVNIKLIKDTDIVAIC